MAVTAPSPIDPLLTGTLVLMSTFNGEGACADTAMEIAHRLGALAGNPAVSPESRTILQRLAVQWLRRSAMPEAGPAPAVGAVVVLH